MEPAANLSEINTFLLNNRLGLQFHQKCLLLKKYFYIYFKSMYLYHNNHKYNQVISQNI